MQLSTQRLTEATGYRYDWETPPDLFACLDSEFGFDLDVCASSENSKCSRYLTIEDDALAHQWSGTCWMNPPFGRDIGRWVRKAYEEAQAGATVVCLLPCRTCTGWWHDYVMKGEVRFLRGRLKFVGAPYNAPFPCAIVVFRPGLASSK